MLSHWGRVRAAMGSGRPRRRRGLGATGKMLLIAYGVPALVVGVAFTAEHAAGFSTTTPLEQVADVIVVITPRQRHSLNRAAIVDRIVDGDIVQTEKGVRPTVIMHTRNSITAPLEAGVPVRLYLKAFKDGHAYYIIGVSSEPSMSQP
jgi:hypothetical protein